MLLPTSPSRMAKLLPLDPLSLTHVSKPHLIFPLSEFDLHVLANIAPSTPSIDVDSVISTVEEQLSGKFNGVKSLKYLTKPDGSIALTHTVQVQNSDTNAWFEAFVDAHTGELLSVTDFVAQATVCGSLYLAF